MRGVVVGNASEQFSHHSGRNHFPIGFLKRNSRVDRSRHSCADAKLREHGVLLGQIVPESESPLSEIPDPNQTNLVAEVSVNEVSVLEPEEFCGITIALIDTGVKNNILRSFLRRGVRIVRCPWNVDCSTLPYTIDGLFLANGPGDPETVASAIAPNIAWAEEKKILFLVFVWEPNFSAFSWSKTYKLRYGHRGVNQPCFDVFAKSSYY